MPNVERNRSSFFSSVIFLEPFTKLGSSVHPDISLLFLTLILYVKAKVFLSCSFLPCPQWCHKMISGKCRYLVGIALTRVHLCKVNNFLHFSPDSIWTKVVVKINTLYTYITYNLPIVYSTNIGTCRKDVFCRQNGMSQYLLRFVLLSHDMSCVGR